MTLDELEHEMKAVGLRGVTVSFGQSVAASQRGRWFANTGPRTPQFYGDTLEDVLRQVLGAEQPQGDLLV